MEIIIYTTEGCYYCEQIKELCSRANVEYTSYLVGSKDISQQDFLTKYPLATGYPYVKIDGEIATIGVTDYIKHLFKSFYLPGSLQVSWYNQLKKVKVSIFPNA